MTRISILDKDRCQPKQSDYLCIHYCPGVRMEEDTIVIDEDTKKPLISEELCEGCGICTNRCPFDAISIIIDTYLNKKAILSLIQHHVQIYCITQFHVYLYYTVQIFQK